jgi:hypothetical protein
MVSGPSWKFKNNLVGARFTNQKSASPSEYFPNNVEDPGIQWLVEYEDLSVRYFTMTDLLDRREDSLEVEKAHKLRELKASGSN